ncbi:hypothetical protein ACSBR1_007743 [Camellia fascicularis]
MTMFLFHFLKNMILHFHFFRYIIFINKKKNYRGKYYLVNNGYPNRIGYLAPFKGSLDHHQQFRIIERCRTVNNPKELFNKVHASLQSVVECNFNA